MGDAAEPIIVDRLEEHGNKVIYALDKQQTVEWAWPKGGLIFRGHPDGNFYGKGVGANIAKNLEMKALNHERTEAIVEQGVQVVTPAYYDQVHGYMRAKDQAETLLVIMDRNDGRIHEIVVPFDREHWKGLVNRWLEVVPIILGGELPERDFGQGSFPCAVCKFRDECWGKS